MKLHLAKISQTTFIERDASMTQLEFQNMKTFQTEIYNLVKKVKKLPKNQQRTAADEGIALYVTLHQQFLDRVENLEDIARQYARVQYTEMKIR